MKLHRYVEQQRLHITTKDRHSYLSSSWVICPWLILSISVLLLFRHYISHKITFGAPSSGGVLCSACGAFIKLLTEHHLEFLSLKGGCRGSSKSTLVKISNCWKSHAPVTGWNFPPVNFFPGGKNWLGKKLTVTLQLILFNNIQLHTCNLDSFNLDWFSNQSICCGYSLEQSHRDDPFEHPKYVPF